MSLKVRLELNVEALSTLYVLDTFFLPQEFSSSKNVKKKQHFAWALLHVHASGVNTVDWPEFCPLECITAGMRIALMRVKEFFFMLKNSFPECTSDDFFCCL